MRKGSHVLHRLTQKLIRSKRLSVGEAATAARALALPNEDFEEKKSFLIALSNRGEPFSAVTAFAEIFRDLARDPKVDLWRSAAIDVCGTGGDGSHSFNISTFVSFILAAEGVPVFKHGARSNRSQCGSADLLEALGFKLDLEDARIHASLEALSYAFFFAPAFHPAYSNIVPVRKALGEEGHPWTIFNFLGPLINPGRPAYQLLGMFDEKWLVPTAQTLASLGLRRGLVVHGKPREGGQMDELTCSGANRVVGFGELEGFDEVWEPEAFGLKPCPQADLAGGSVKDNVTLCQHILEGKAPTGLVDTILWNAGASFWAANKDVDVQAGITRARNALESGAVATWLKKAQAFYTAAK